MRRWLPAPLLSLALLVLWLLLNQSLAAGPAPDAPASASSSADSIATLPTNPDSGGSPAMTSAPTANATPRKASAAGRARPISGASWSSRLTTPTERASTKAGSGPATISTGGSISAWRARSSSSTSRYIAVAASVELAR